MKDDNELAIQIKPKDFELIQEFDNDAEKQLRLYNLIFRGSFLGEELNEEDMAIKMAAKAILADIQECKKNYKEKCKKNAEFGILGKEYGIQGKEFGKLGGRTKKGESPEEYAKRKMPLRLKMGIKVKIQ